MSEPFRHRRVMVYGVTGSGKSTLAARLSGITGIAWHAIDDLMWEPGWVPVPAEEQRRIITDLCAQDCWIIDHGYGSWLDVPMGRADLVIGLDLPRWLSLARLVRRSVLSVLGRRPICNGNIETWRTLLARDSILVWHFRSFARKRARIRAWEKDSPGPAILRFTGPRQLDAWLRSLSTADASGAHRPHPHRPQE
ncbi:adenylate kinase [Propionibacteriaceae bacterium Y1700]|uniref:adenylate kinase n=1 Tax=Microlunatus sp. Y1700 TaxID=3418487 RepID=UPI003DA77E15